MENQSLPQTDPFSYTLNEAPSVRKQMILRGNWLAEVIFYKLYSLLRFKGIIILRSLLLLLSLFFIFLNIKNQGVPHLLTLLMVVGVFFIARKTGGERPQLFTFAVFSIAYYLLENFRINRSKSVVLIPFLLLMLSNMHPGYIVCLMLVTIYLLGEGARSLLKRDFKDGAFKIMFMIWFLTVILSMINPNGATVYSLLFSIHGDYIQGIVEFRSTFSLYASKVMSVDYSYIAFLLFSLFGLRYLKRTGIIHLTLLIVFTYMSLFAIRYVIFYMFIAAPIIARIMTNLKEEKLLQRSIGILRERENLLNAIACIIGIFLVFNAIPSFARYEFRADTMYSAPKDAADFLNDVNIKGNMLNEYGFGGYLLWRLYPEKKVFIDGRMLEEAIYREYQILVYAEEDPGLSWEDIIEKYNISYIIMPPLFHHGSIYPIVEKLFVREEWVLIYTDHLSLIFLRNNPENSAVIKDFAIDKKKGLQTIVIQASAMALKKQGNPYPLISLGKTFFMMGRFDDSQKAFLMAYQRDPGNQELKFWMQKLEQLKNEAGFAAGDTEE